MLKVQDTIRIVRQAFGTLDNYPDDRIQLQVSRSALGVGDRTPNAETGESSITPAPEFDHLYWYPPESSTTRNNLHSLVEIMDDAWAFLHEVPPGRVRVFVRPTNKDRNRGEWLDLRL